MSAPGRQPTTFANPAAEPPRLSPTELVLGADGETPERSIVEALERIRDLDGIERGVADGLAAQVQPGAPLLEGRDAFEVPRLRAYLLVTLADVGFASSIEPTIRDVLAHADDRARAVELGAALRAARALGPDASELAPFVLQAMTHRRADEEIGLERLDPAFERDEATTVRLEAISAIPAVATSDDVPRARAALEEIASGAPGSDPRAARAARAALVALNQHVQTEPRNATVGDASAPETGSPLPANLRYVDHEGRSGQLHELLDRPTVLAFFYSRCQNAFKCSATVRRLADLQALLGERLPASSFRVIAVSFEPAYETSETVARFTRGRGMALGASGHALVMEPRSQRALVEALEVGVSYDGETVSLHAVEAFLLDPKGRLMRRYRDVRWKNAEVADDVVRLARDLEAPPLERAEGTR